VLEDRDRALARGASIRAEIVGYGLVTDATHITRPSVEGQAAALRAALENARMSPGDIGYINAHGTGTQANDGVETAAIRRVFGDRAPRIPVSSTKSMHGHLLGAAGAVELLASVVAMERGIVPPTRNLKTPDPECDLDYVAEGAREAPGLDAVLSSSFAFGGTNAVLIARRYS
jgi:3-oxoacyl-(acyl-carrier-protein) synthase